MVGIIKNILILILTGTIIICLFTFSSTHLQYMIYVKQINDITTTLILSFFCIFITSFTLFIRRKRFIYDINIMDTVFTLYFLYILIRIYTVPNINVEHVYFVSSLFMFYIALRVQRKSNFKYYILLLSVAGLFQLIYSISRQAEYYTFAEKIIRVHGVFLNTSIWGGFVAILFLISISYLLLPQQNRYIRILNLILAFIWAAILLASNARGAWLAAIGGLIYLLLRYFDTSNKKIRFFIPRGIVLGGFLMFLLYRYKTASADGRLVIWNISWEMIKENPLFGFGINGFKKHYMHYQSIHLQEFTNTFHTYLSDENVYAFNELIKIWVEQGAFGLLFTILCIYVVVKAVKIDKCSKRRFSESDLSIAILISFFIFGMFSYPSDVFQMSVLFILFLAHTASNLSPSFKTVVCMNKIFVFCSIFCVSGIITILFPHLINYKRASAQWRAIIYKPATIENIHKIESLLPILKHSDPYLYEYGMKLNELKNEKAIKILEKSNNLYSSYYTLMELSTAYENAQDFIRQESSLIKASQMIPHKFTPHYRLLLLYEKTGRQSEALEKAQYILHKRIKIRTCALNEILDHTEDIYEKIKESN